MDRVKMNSDAGAYNKSNYSQMRDARHFLEQFKDKINFKPVGDRSIDIGCGDGSVTNMIKNYLPLNFDRLIGCDLQKSMVEYAANYSGDNRITFRAVDIEEVIPKDLIESFDHVFSFYALHYIRKQEQAFQNIYNLLVRGGDCLLTFLAYSPTYVIYQTLALTEKWKSHLDRVNEFVSPYHDVQEPDIIVENIMKEIGFCEIDVKSKQMIFTYDSIDKFTDKIRGINPFAMPNDEFEDFLKDCVQIAQNMNMVYSDKNQTRVVINKYNLIVVYGRKI